MADDLIRRQDAIEVLKTDCSWLMYDEYGNLTQDGRTIIDAIESIPTAEPTLNEEKIAAEYCMKHWLVMVSMETYEQLIAYYGRVNGLLYAKGGEDD